MTETIVDFNKPCIVGKEYEYMADSIRLSHISGDGKYSKQCHAFLEKELEFQGINNTIRSHALD